MRWRSNALALLMLCGMLVCFAGCGGGGGSQGSTPTGTPIASSGGNSGTTNFVDTVSESQKQASITAIQNYFQTLPHQSQTQDNSLLLSFLQTRPEFTAVSLDDPSGTLSATWADNETLAIFNSPEFDAIATPSPTPDLASPSLGTRSSGSTPSKKVILLNGFALQDSQRWQTANISLGNLNKGFLAVNDPKGGGFQVTNAAGTIANYKALVQQVDVAVFKGHGGVVTAQVANALQALVSFGQTGTSQQRVFGLSVSDTFEPGFLGLGNFADPELVYNLGGHALVATSGIENASGALKNVALVQQAYITGQFASQYFTFNPQSVVYLGCCFGAGPDSLKQFVPNLKGAGSVFGWTNITLSNDDFAVSSEFFRLCLGLQLIPPLLNGRIPSLDFNSAEAKLKTEAGPNGTSLGTSVYTDPKSGKTSTALFQGPADNSQLGSNGRIAPAASSATGTPGHASIEGAFGPSTVQPFSAQGPRDIGVNDVSVTLQVNANTVVTLPVDSVTDTDIECNVPASATAGQVQVSVDGVTSNFVPLSPTSIVAPNFYAVAFNQSGSDELLAINTATGTMKVLPVALTAPSQIARAPNGDIVVPLRPAATGSLLLIPPDGSTFSYLIPPNSTLQGPVSTSADSSGDIAVADSFGSSGGAVYVLPAGGGSIQTVPNVSGITPITIAYDPSGKLFEGGGGDIVGASDVTLAQVLPSLSVLVDYGGPFGISPNDIIARPDSVAFDPLQNNLPVVAESTTANAPQVAVTSIQGGQRTVLATIPNVFPVQIVKDPTSTGYFVAVQGTGLPAQIVAVAPPNGTQPAQVATLFTFPSATLRVNGMCLATPITITGPASGPLSKGGTFTFTATGGAGDGFTWALTTSASGGSINASTGAYTAGQTAGTDVVTVTDAAGFTATANVTVQ